MPAWTGLPADGVVAVVYADSGPDSGVLPDLRALTALAGTATLALQTFRSIPA